MAHFRNLLYLNCLLALSFPALATADAGLFYFDVPSRIEQRCERLLGSELKGYADVGLRLSEVTAEDRLPILNFIAPIRASLGRTTNMRADPKAVDADLLNVAKYYSRKRGRFLVVRDANSEIVGTGAFTIVSEPEANWVTCELRKMYTNQVHKGLGRAILKELIQSARKLGCSEMTLKTHSNAVAAINLYKSVGFSEIALTRSAESESTADLAFALPLLPSDAHTNGSWEI